MSASVSDTYGSAHLPECFLSEPCHPSLPEHNDLRGELSKCRTCGLPCACDRLRACEQRIMLMRYNEIRGWQAMKERIAYDAGLDAAVAAIRALKEKP